MVEWEQINALSWTGRLKDFLIVVHKDSFHIKQIDTPRSVFGIGEELGFDHWKRRAEEWLSESDASS